MDNADASRGNAGELPKGWVKARLESISEIILGQSPPSSTYNEQGRGLPFYQGKLEFGNVYPTPRKWCSAPKKIAEKGDVLISVRAPVGPTNICPERSAIGRGLAAIRGLAGIEPLFVLYLIRAFEHVIASKGTGSTFDAITRDQLRSLDIPVPPLAEQHRIVAKVEQLLSDLDAGVAALQKAKAQLKRYRQAMLKAAVTGELTAEWRAANAGKIEPASVLLERIRAERAKNANGKTNPLPPLNEAEMGELPDSWCWVHAQEICDFITKGTTPAAGDLKSGSGDIPFVKVYNLTNRGLLDFSVNPTFVNRETHGGKLARSKVFPGDVLMNIVGPPLGKVSVVPRSYSEWNVNQAIAIFRPLTGYEKSFLCYSLLTDSILSWAIDRTKATAGQSNLTLEICRALPLPVPPTAEQQQIVPEVERRLSAADEVERTVDAGLARAVRLRQSILKRAFSGKLVPQDPNDEPAEKLLERIKAARNTDKLTKEHASKRYSSSASRGLNDIRFRASS